MHTARENLDTPINAPGLAARQRIASWSRHLVSHERLSLGAVALLSALLNFVALASEGYANTYYAATVS